jgi:nucleotide-binding universal stress UspA family protein
MSRRILVGYDGSDSAKRAFRLAVDLARAFGGRVRVVTVLQPVVSGIEGMAVLVADNSPQHTTELLQELVGSSPDAAELVETAVLNGSPGDVLLSEVEQHGIDHIVIGHSERGALARWLVGSVSTDVLARSHVPVTVVR